MKAASRTIAATIARIPKTQFFWAFIHIHALSEGFLSLGQRLLDAVLVCSGDLVSQLNNGPYGAYYGLLWGLIGDTSRTYEVN